MNYNPDNIFARILRGEIPCQRIHEDKYTLSFYDTNPQKPVHALVIPKEAYTNANDMAEYATDQELGAFYRAIATVAQKTGIAETGYRFLCNVGTHGRQEIPHVHVHVLGGTRLSSIL